MKPFSSLALALVLLCTTSWAQTTPPPAGAERTSDFVPTLDTLKEAKDLMTVEALWTKPLAWNEKAATTADIAAHLRQMLGDTVRLEVRGHDTNRSTFTLKQAPLGPTLSSIASLANAKLWAFPGRLLIAPATALTLDENADIKLKLGGEWKNSASAGGTDWNARTQFEQISVLLVGADLKQRFAAKGLAPLERTPPPNQTLDSKTGQIRGTFVHTSGPSFAYELQLSDLAPSTRNILQSLVDERFQAMSRYAPPDTPPPHPVVSDETIVSFDDASSNQIYLRLQNKDPQDAQKSVEIGAWYLNKPLFARADSH